MHLLNSSDQQLGNTQYEKSMPSSAYCIGSTACLRKKKYSEQSTHLGKYHFISTFEQNPENVTAEIHTSARNLSKL